MDSAFGTYRSIASYRGMVTRSRYLTMRDGVQIAVDLHMPGNYRGAARLPTLVCTTRYWRALDLRPGFGWIERERLRMRRYLTAHGYAVLDVDARGTGASFGTRQHEWDREEVRDGGDIADWIVAQPWSNGRIGAFGVSYAGSAAELFCVPNHPAVRAVVPAFSEFDLYTDIAFPGGMFLRGFVEAWAAANRALDANRLPIERLAWLERLAVLGIRGVKPVDADPTRTLLQAAVAEHQRNGHADQITPAVRCREDLGAAGFSVDDLSIHRQQAAIERSGVAIYGWGSWFDAVTADAVIRRFQTLSNPQLAVIGAWNHGGEQHASPYALGRNDMRLQWNEYLRFFDAYLLDRPTGAAQQAQERTLTYFTIGEERWKTTRTWPPAARQVQTWYCDAEGALSAQPPAADGVDHYRVDFRANSGKTNRWYTQAGGTFVRYGDRAKADRRLLTYTSPPLPHNVEITGHPVVQLWITASNDDAALLVYLEELDPHGRVTYLTEGVLRASHRASAASDQGLPYRSFTRADLRPLLPGQPTELRFALFPLSALIQRGHRLRIAVAGADHQLFPRLPERGRQIINVLRQRGAASRIELPWVVH